MSILSLSSINYPNSINSTSLSPSPTFSYIPINLYTNTSALLPNTIIDYLPPPPTLSFPPLIFLLLKNEISFFSYFFFPYLFFPYFSFFFFFILLFSSPLLFSPLLQIAITSPPSSISLLFSNSSSFLFISLLHRNLLISNLISPFLLN